jgi:superfamily II DNA helicase RecQ
MPRHILVAVEQSEASDFQECVSQLVAQRRLARMILDELHLFLTHAEFCHVMNMIEWAGRQNIQIVGQTATLPPSLEASAFAKLGISNYVICRTKTTHPNISYNISAAKVQSSLVFKQTF